MLRSSPMRRPKAGRRLGREADWRKADCQLRRISIGKAPVSAITASPALAITSMADANRRLDLPLSATREWAVNITVDYEGNDDWDCRIEAGAMSVAGAQVHAGSFELENGSLVFMGLKYETLWDVSDFFGRSDALFFGTQGFRGAKREV